MCTIGYANLDSIYIFKNRDPIRGTPIDEWLEEISFGKSKMLVIKNHQGCYGGLNNNGVGIIGTFVNMVADQKNYFDGEYLPEILSHGDINGVVEYLTYNPEQLYGNIICSDGNGTYALEMNGSEVNVLKISDRYLMTNHFQQIKKSIRTISDPFISQWTYSRLERGKQLMPLLSDVESIKHFLSDHENGSDFSICNHGRIPTASSYIIDCTEKVILYCKGSPCSHEYVAYNFNH